MTGPVPLAVRVKNARVDKMLTGYLIGGVKFTKTDPGGMRAASFVVSQRLGFRRDTIQPYSRIYIYNQCNGDTVFEGDVSHPGRSVGDAGELLEVQVEGGVERLNDWSGARIYVDRDMQAWTKSSASVVATNVEAGEDRGGSGLDALTLAFPTDLHVENNHACLAGYFRFREAGQTIGRFDYTDDGGHTSGSPGWQIQAIITPPSILARTATLNVGGHTSSPVNTTGNGANIIYVQLIWTSGSSSTGTSGNDIVWVSIKGLVVVAELKLKDGTPKTSGYNNGVTAVKVWEDMLGDMLAATFDGPNAVLDTGSGVDILQFAFPDGTTPMQIADELMKYEPACTYLVGPSKPGSDKYSLRWMARTDTPRYEFTTWVDEYSAGAQAVDQYNQVVARWKDPIGNIKMTTSTQSIPEMTAAGRTRRYFQDLGTITGDDTNAATANAAILEQHRFPQNGGRITVSRQVVDLYTGRRVQPFEIEPGYVCRIVGVNPSRDALNSSPRNGATLCRIVTTDYDADSNSVSIDLDSEPWSMFRAIAKTKKTVSTPQRKSF